MEPAAAVAREALIISAGNGIELRPMSIRHADELYALIDRNRARLRQWLPWVTRSFSMDDLVAFIRDRERDNAERVSLATAILANGELCGAVGLHVIDRRHRNTCIGYWIAEEHEGRGIVTQACRAIVAAGFRDYGLHRIVIRCATGNSRSAAVARRLGFTEEGILKEAEWLFDHWVDLRVFGMLEQHWK